MMNKIIGSLSAIFVIICLNTYSLNAQKRPEVTEIWEPQPKIISFENETPSDAIVLFDGTNLDSWTNMKDEPAEWLIEDGYMTVNPKKGNIKTKESFGSCQLHIEWRSPLKVEGEGQGRGNSGIFLMSRYEVQVLDNYNNKTYSNGQASSIYKQSIPLVNACKKPGEWQTYDIIFIAPTFNEDGMRTSPGYITVLHNGVVTQNHTQIQGTTEYIGLPRNIAHDHAPLMLQDHDNPVSFRNIWIRKI